MTDLPQWAMEKADDVWTALANNEAHGRDAETLLFARALVEARQQGREEMRKGIQDLLAHGAPHSPRRYIYDTTPDRRNWANDQLDESIRKLAAQEGK
jgi:hypothetical protein